MKKWLPFIITGIFALWIISSLRAPAEKTEYNINEFGRLPVLLNGRIQPLDSVARNTLLILMGKQTVALEEPRELSAGKRFTAFLRGARKASENEWIVTTGRLSATEWLLEAMTRPEEADTRKIFRIDHPELLALLHLPEDEKHFAFSEIKPQALEWEKQARTLAEHERTHNIDTKLRTPFQKQMMKLYFSVTLYNRVKNSLRPEGSVNFAREVELYEEVMPAGIRSLKLSQAQQDFNQQDLALLLEFFNRYRFMSQVAYPLAVPPLNLAEDRNAWKTVGDSLLEAMHTGAVHPAVKKYAAISSAYTSEEPAKFNRAVAEYRHWLQEKGLDKELRKSRKEFFYNQFAPFYKSGAIYVFAFVLACISWFNGSGWLNRSAFYLILMALVIHTSGLLFRMLLEGRPPVTNLYSSAIFVGWGAVVLGAILERFYRDGIGSAVAASIGFLTLIVAHNLSLDGDTMEMMRAVLDTNFWLATHVVVITLGYSAMFIAGGLAILYVIRGMFTSSLNAATAKSLNRMVYGIICFATLFSFLGTVLGGIWADQSWGRFWGWDPKENGALLIVLWCAIILHSRWGGLIRDQGLMAMAIFGNVVTSFSWFGTNMLGVGLHSYGFMDAAFKWLVLFDITQLIFIGLALVPLQYWMSGANLQKEPKIAVQKLEPVT
jgi:ABC-type transport system involved in cytochrome c biogenesis permease subunit